MRVLVGVKRVIDYAVRVRVAADGKGVELANTKMAMNPFCEIAVEEAVRLKESGKATEVVVVSVGPKQAAETLRSAIAMGADRAIHVKTDLRIDQDLEPLAIAKLLQAVVLEQKPGLVLLGKQSIDGDNATTAPMLAELLGWPQVTFASKLEEISEDSATVERETDTGTEVLKIALPAVISADLRLNTPRYPKLPNIMKAKKKPLDELNAADLGVDLSPLNVVMSVASPAARKSGVKVPDVETLVKHLKEDGHLS